MLVCLHFFARSIRSKSVDIAGEEQKEGAEELQETRWRIISEHRSRRRLEWLLKRVPH